VDERPVAGPAHCWTCGYPIAPETALCSECGAPRTEAWERWSRATRIDAFDASAAVGMLARIRWCAIALMVASAAWILVPPMLPLALRSSLPAVVFLYLLPDGIVPWVAVLGLWPVLHGRWMRLVCWVTLSMSVVRLAELVMQEWFATPATSAMLAKPLAVLGLTSIGILMPAGSLVVLMVAALRLATGLRWPWRYALTVGAAGLAAVLCLAWAGAFVAANTEGLGAWQPTLARMLQILRFTWLISALSVLLMSALLVGVSRALARRLR
jgi:predicted nucleic acid-binding Zn ribbon protein